LISGSFLSFPFMKKMSSYIIRLCCSWFWNISLRSLINLFLLSIRSFWNWNKYIKNQWISPTPVLKKMIKVWNGKWPICNGPLIQFGNIHCWKDCTKLYIYTQYEI
jgi:hypothetical protein